MDRSGLDDKSAPFQGEAKGFVGRGLLGGNPDHQHTGRTQEVQQPIKRDFGGFERAPPPIDQRDVILAGRKAAVRRGCASAATPARVTRPTDVAVVAFAVILTITLIKKGAAAASDVSLAREAPGASTMLNALPARIVSRSLLGQSEVLRVLVLGSNGGRSKDYWRHAWNSIWWNAAE